jgi:integrase
VSLAAVAASGLYPGFILKRHSMASTYEVMRFTEASVRAARPVTDATGFVGPRKYKDSQTKGLLLIVGRNTKSFVLRGTIAGREVRRALGEFGDITLTEARDRVEATRVKFKTGLDPLLEARRVAEQERAVGITLQEAWELTRARMKQKHRSSKTIAGYEAALNLYFKGWLKRPLIKITREDAANRHRAIAREISAGKYREGDRTGEAAANGAMRIFRAIWNSAARLHPELPVCPTIAVEMFERPRQRAVTLDGIGEWWTMTESASSIRRDYLRFMLMSGLRRTSAAEIRWEHIDWSKRTLRIVKPKGGEKRAFTLPLTKWMIGMLKARREQNRVLYSRSPWCFPADSASGHIVEAREGDVLQPHDLRRIFASTAADLGIEGYTLKALLNHSGSRDVAKRRAMEQISARLLMLAQKKSARKSAR